ncbi:putative eukaryotic translation initiation factor 4 gamma [Trypanosoma grayi]|uniref:putative eukaryotic translation initiation factor 4 gamma n=1 Tax=Trypanosoma grayi TaxID=71804 RepID=UPI0004F49795|nr:putative eukaryotic translation initiation factor 4 gamma [Trypanosoma grayi]KEG13527.1 putative eukaryotic translation initiation factor 4 gamma [Trypanosoma grayi]
MHVYSIQQILDVRSLYKEPPYPGFSLEEACRRKKSTQTKLVRGPNAWVVRGSAKTTEEWVERRVQGSLNRLSVANFDEMVARLQTNLIFSTEETLKKTVGLIFKKALEEPENSKSYAGMCYKLAEYEVSLTAAKQPAEGRKHSKLRNAVVGIAQEEFQSRRKMPSVEGLTEEEIELQRTTFMRRKRANMKFVGELFMHKVLSHNTMMNIIQTIMQEAEKGGHPTSEDIEFLTELFLTIGESLDAVPELRAKVDGYFKLLEHLKDQKEVYPPRIRFKMLDLIELRRDLNWEPRAAAAPKTSAATQKEPLRVTDKPTTRSPATVNATNTPTSGAKKNKQTAVFPDSAPSQPAAVAAAPSGDLGWRNWRNVVKTAASPCDPGVLRAPEPVVTFEARVRSLFQEWVAECTNDFIPEWMNEFRNCQRHFDSGDALCKAAAAEVVREACMTTKKEAQREASSFLIVGLLLADDEVFDGFAMALATAIEEGILEDVPKFSERFINMLRITSGEDVAADVYYDTARVLCRAYGMMREPDESVLDTLMEFWGKIPRPPPDECVLLPLPVVQSLAEMPTHGQAPLTGRIIASLHAVGVVDDETIERWLEMPLEGVAADVVEAFKTANKCLPTKTD